MRFGRMTAAYAMLIVGSLLGLAGTPDTASAEGCLSCTNASCADGPSGVCQCTDSTFTTCHYRGLPQANRNCTVKAEE